MIRFEICVIIAMLTLLSKKQLLLIADIDKCNRKLIFKNNALYANCISKINNVLIDNAEDVDIVMPM